MKRATIFLIAGMLAFTALGSRYGYEERCKALAQEIVKTWFQHGPAFPEDIARAERFEALGCGDPFLQVEKQRIISGEVEPWVEVVD